jgi:hypothetical protein
MDVILGSPFLMQIAAHGLRLDDRYEEPRCLSYQNNLWIGIPMPAEVVPRAKAISAALEFIDPHLSVCLWPRGGVWRYGPAARPASVRRNLEEAVAAVFRAFGIVEGTQGALRFAPDEKDKLFALVLTNSLAAATVRDDIFVVPDDPQFVLYFDHDGQIILEFRDEPARDQITSRLRSRFAELHLPVDWD